MSRNLCMTNCDQCGDKVRVTEQKRPITKNEVGAYTSEYLGRLWVACALCDWCGAKYLAWFNYPGEAIAEDFIDLSYSSTFNDEPGDADLPSHGVITSVRIESNGHHDRVTLFNRGALAGTITVCSGDGLRIKERLKRKLA